MSRELQLERRSMVEEVVSSLGNMKRLAALEEITKGTPAKEIHENIGASRSGVQHFINDFKEADLVREADGAYELTEKGGVVVDTLQSLDAEFEAFEREKFLGFAKESSLSVEEMEKMLETVKQTRES